MAGDLRQSRPIAAAVLARNNKQLAPRELGRKVATGRTQEHDAFDIPWRGSCIRLSHRISTHTPADRRDPLDSPLMEIFHRGEYIRCVVRSGTKRARGSIRILPVSSKGDRQYNEPCTGQPLCLPPPTGLIETPAVRQDDAALGVVILSSTIDICLNLVLGSSESGWKPSPARNLGSQPTVTGCSGEAGSPHHVDKSMTVWMSACFAPLASIRAVTQEIIAFPSWAPLLCRPRLTHASVLGK